MDTIKQYTFEVLTLDLSVCINLFQLMLWWWIVPRVQWDFFALLYQMYTFDIFHYGFL